MTYRNNSSLSNVKKPVPKLKNKAKRSNNDSSSLKTPLLNTWTLTSLSTSSLNGHKGNRKALKLDTFLLLLTTTRNAWPLAPPKNAFKKLFNNTTSSNHSITTLKTLKMIRKTLKINCFKHLYDMFTSFMMKRSKLLSKTISSLGSILIIKTYLKT